MYIKRTTKREWLAALELVQIGYPRVAGSTTKASELVFRGPCKYFIYSSTTKDSVDNNVDLLSGGFAIRRGELVGLYSLEKGLGARMVNHAITEGAVRLNCAGTVLRDYYKKFGFAVHKVEAGARKGHIDLFHMYLGESW